MRQPVDQRAHGERAALALLRLRRGVRAVAWRNAGVRSPARIPFKNTGRKAEDDAQASAGEARARAARGTTEGNVRVLGHNLSTWTGNRIDMGRRQQIKQFILGNFLFTDDDSALADDTSLIQQGIVDSTGILELIGFIEETWQVQVPPQDMTPANFDSLGSIDRYLDGRLAG